MFALLTWLLSGRPPGSFAPSSVLASTGSSRLEVAVRRREADRGGLQPVVEVVDEVEGLRGVLVPVRQEAARDGRVPRAGEDAGAEGRQRVGEVPARDRRLLADGGEVVVVQVGEGVHVRTGQRRGSRREPRGQVHGDGRAALGGTREVAVDRRVGALHQVPAPQRPARRRVHHDAIRVRRVGLDGGVPDDGLVLAGEDAERGGVAVREGGGRPDVVAGSRRRRDRRDTGAAQRGDTGLRGGQARRGLDGGDARDRRTGDVDEPSVGGHVRAQTAVQRRNAADRPLLPEQALQAADRGHAADEHEVVDVGLGETERRAVRTHVAERDVRRVGGRGRRQEPVQAADHAQAAVAIVDRDDRVATEARPERGNGGGVRSRGLQIGADIDRVAGGPAGISGGRLRRDRDREEARHCEEATHPPTLTQLSRRPIPPSGSETWPWRAGAPWPR